MKQGRFTKLLSVIMVLSMILMLLPITIAADTDSNSAPVTLTWYLYGSRQEPATDTVCAAASDYLKKTYGMNVKISLKFFDPNTYRVQMASKIANGEPFDICFTSNWSLDYFSNASRGAFLPLDQYLKTSSIPGILGQEFLDASKVNDKNYGLPAYKEEAHNYGLLLRKDLVSKYNIDISSIHTLSDMDPIFTRIKAAENGIVPLYVNAADTAFPLLNWNNLGLDYPGALYPDNRDYTVVNEFATPETAAHFAQMRDYYLKGFLPNNSTRVSIDTNTALSTGKVFAVVQSLKPHKADEMSVTTGVNWVQVNITAPVVGTPDVTGAMLAIGTHSQHPDIAFQFVEKLYTDPILKNMFDNGIEGVNFTYNNGTFQRISLTDTTKIYNPGMPWEYGNYFSDYANLPWKAEYEAYNKSARMLNTVGFVFDPGPVYGQVGAVTNVERNYLPGLSNGTLDPAVELPKFLDELKAAGIDAVIAEMQRQVNVWKGKQNSPKNLIATAGQGKVSLSWTASTDPQLAGYQLEYKPTLDEDWTSVNLAQSATSFTVTGLGMGTGYDFRIKEKDSKNNWSEYSDIASVVFPPSPAPQNISFSFDGQNAGRLMGITTDMEYSLDGGQTYAFAGSSNQLLTSEELGSISADSDIMVRIASKSGAAAGEDSVLDILEGPGAPSLTGNDTLNTVDGLTSSMEFSIDNGVTWSRNVPSLNGTIKLMIRIAGAGLVLPGAATTLNFTANPSFSANATYKGNVITVNIVNGRFTTKINKDKFILTGLPSGTTKGTVTRASDTKVTITLKGSGKYSKSSKVSIKIDKSQIIPVQSNNCNITVTIPANK